MSDYVIVSDSTCDLSPDMISDLELVIIPMPVAFGEEDFMHYPDAREMSFKTFYDRVRNGEMPTTAQINLQLYLDYFEGILKDGEDILYLGFSSGLTGSLANARIAVDELKEKYPERKIVVVDTLSASTGEGFLVYYTAMEKRAGKSLEEAAKYAEDNKLRVNHWFTVSDLNHLRRGGRISGASAFAGTLMGIKPLLNFNVEGKMETHSKIRGRAKVMQELVDKMEQLCVKPEEQTIFLSHADCLEDVLKVEKMIRERFNVKDVVLNYIGPVIGAHAGPDTIALFFFADKR